MPKENRFQEILRVAYDPLQDGVSESHDWLKERHERLMRELEQLLAQVPGQGAGDPMEEIILRVRFLTERLKSYITHGESHERLKA